MTTKTYPLKNLPPDLNRERLPRHVAVIMDGNGRWAKLRGAPRVMGHQRGADVLKDLVICCAEWGVEAITAYAFSTENWGRPTAEVDFLMRLFESLLRQELQEMIAQNVRIQFVGNLQALPPSLQAELQQAMRATQENTGIRLIVAANYGGRQEIVQACRAIATEVAEGRLTPDAIDEALFERHLSTADICEPDLLIRTSGEMRVSNFLLWQIAYAEIYVTDTLWPDFDREEFHQALINYQQRERRFGRL